MSKSIKHENVLKPNPGKNKSGYNYSKFICRGGSISYRKNIWHGFVSSISETSKRKDDNSYLILVEEPENKYDPEAVMILCCGEFFGTVGYVDREFTRQVKEILDECYDYRVDMINEDEAGTKEIALLLTWENYEQYKANKERIERKINLTDEEKIQRKKLHLPVTKPLRYMRRLPDLDYEEVDVEEYKIIDSYMPSDTASLEVTLETGERIMILAPFFSHMQKSSFEYDMMSEFETE